MPPEKKRVPAKAKKPAPKKTAKSESVETKETKQTAREEKNMDVVNTRSEEQVEDLKANGNALGNKETGQVAANYEHDEEGEVEGDEGDAEDERQPYFEGPKNGQGVRPQDVRLTDEYTIETFFDKAQRLFIATVVEYPELRCTGHTRDEAQVDLEERLEDYVYDLKARGGNVAEAVQSRQYPDSIKLPLSQSLYRKLDTMSRHEKVPLDRLVAELLAAAVEKRGQSRPQQPQQNHSNRDHREHRDNRDHRDHGGGHHNRHHGGGQRHQGGNRPQRGGGGGNNYRALDSRENFMEYVRNLEKGGGPGWKKR